MRAKVIFGAGAATVGLLAWQVYRRLSARAPHVVPDTYEKPELLHQYLCFHYGKSDDVLLHKFGPIEALDFARNCAVECLSAAPQPVKQRALDVGCAVGRSAFEMAREIENVVGIDFSASFIRGCNDLKVCMCMGVWVAV